MTRPEEKTHEHGFYQEEKARHLFDAGLAQALAMLFWQRKVWDVGSGNGAYVRYLREHGVLTWGLEGNRNSVNNETTFCFDLALPLSKYLKGDWAYSIEVGEHIPRVYEETFYDNLCQCGQRGVILSWAYPGQGGRGHVNERTTGDVFVQMGRRDYRRNDALTGRLQEACRFEYLSKTVQVFERR
jgi:hypothetical protein